MSNVIFIIFFKTLKKIILYKLTTLTFRKSRFLSRVIFLSEGAN